MNFENAKIIESIRAVDEFTQAVLKKHKDDEITEKQLNRQSSIQNADKGYYIRPPVIAGVFLGFFLLFLKGGHSKV